jgi:hypothetical protein
MTSNLPLARGGWACPSRTVHPSAQSESDPSRCPTRRIRCTRTPRSRRGAATEAPAMQAPWTRATRRTGGPAPTTTASRTSTVHPAPVPPPCGRPSGASSARRARERSCLARRARPRALLRSRARCAAPLPPCCHSRHAPSGLHDTRWLHDTPCRARQAPTTRSRAREEWEATRCGRAPPAVEGRQPLCAVKGRRARVCFTCVCARALHGFWALVFVPGPPM